MRSRSQLSADGGAFEAHAEAELGINPDTASCGPWSAAISSFSGVHAGGAAAPWSPSSCPGPSYRVPFTFVAVLVALVVTGSVSARLAVVAARGPAIVTGGRRSGALAMAITYVIGHLVGMHV